MKDLLFVNIMAYNKNFPLKGVPSNWMILVFGLARHH